MNLTIALENPISKLKSMVTIHMFLMFGSYIFNYFKKLFKTFWIKVEIIHFKGSGKVIGKVQIGLKFAFKHTNNLHFLQGQDMGQLLHDKLKDNSEQLD